MDYAADLLVVVTYVGVLCFVGVEYGVWSRLEGTWRGWMASRRLNSLQRRIVEEGEELDVCSICHAEYDVGEEVSNSKV